MNTPANEPLCESCEERPAVAIHCYWATEDRFCQECYDALAEATWERRIDDGETFRGGEAAAYNAEQQAWIQTHLKR